MAAELFYCLVCRPSGNIFLYVPISLKVITNFFFRFGMVRPFGDYKQLSTGGFCLIALKVFFRFDRLNFFLFCTGGPFSKKNCSVTLILFSAYVFLMMC
jgi:hypothetical protein